MKSKTSFFNLTVFTKTFFRFWPVWGFYLFDLVVVGPLAFMSTIKYADKEEVVRIVENLATGAIPTAAMLIGFLSAIAVFSYIFKTKSVDFYHSIPVKRSGLFITSYITGFCFSLIPNLLITGVMCLMFAAYSIPVLVILKTLGAMTLAILFFYSMATFCAMICGNIVAVPFAYLILNFLAVAVNGIVMILGEVFLKGFSAGFLPGVRGLSPIVQMYADISKSSMVFSGDQFTHLAIYAAVGVLLTVLSYILCKVRKSETAENLTAFDGARYIFRYLLGMIGAFTIGLLLFVMIVEASSLDAESTGYFIIFFITSLFGGLLAYYVFEMLSQKSFKVFKHSLRAVLPLIVAIVLVCLCGFYDIFGYEKRIPETSEIESIRYSDNYLNTTTKDPEMIVMIRDLHESVINTEAEEDVEFEGDIISQSIYISYHLKNGNTVERYYSYMTDNFESVAEVEQKIDALWSSDAAKRTVIECLTSTERFDYFSIYNMQDTEEYYNDGYINAQALVQALVTDMKNGDDISFKWTESSVWSVDFSADGFYISFYFDDGFENTMEYLNAVKSIRDSVENSVSYD